MSTRFDRLVEDIRSFVRERDWEQFHNPKNLAMAVVSEAGELAAELRWVADDKSDEHCNDEKFREQIENEAADVFATLIMFADRTGIDLFEVTHRKMQKNRSKYPAEEWRGK